MTREQSTTRIKYGLLALVVIAAFTAGGLIGIPIQESSANEAETVDGLDYSFKPSCKDHIAISGEHIQDCTIQVNVKDLGDAQYVEVRTIDGISYATKVSTVFHANEQLEGMVYVGRDGDSELMYWDVAVVSAVTESGETVVLEEHKFSCEDVYYANACDQSAEERAS